jgi:hypothetical protein
MLCGLNIASFVLNIFVSQAILNMLLRPLLSGLDLMRLAHRTEMPLVYQALPDNFLPYGLDAPVLTCLAFYAN